MSRRRIIDLSRPSHTGTPVYPVLPRTFLQRYTTFDDWEGTNYWPSSTDLLMMSTHAGTHVDANCHMAPGTISIEHADLDLLFGDAIRLDVSGLAPGEEVSLEQTRAALERDELSIEPRLIVHFHTGMSRFGMSPSISSRRSESARKSCRGCSTRAFSSTASMPPARTSTSSRCPAISGWGERPHHQIENLVNLDAVPSRFTFLGLPLPLVNATASPIRAVALVGES